MATIPPEDEIVFASDEPPAGPGVAPDAAGWAQARPDDAAPPVEARDGAGPAHPDSADTVAHAGGTAAAQPQAEGATTPVTGGGHGQTAVPDISADYFLDTPEAEAGGDAAAAALQPGATPAADSQEMNRLDSLLARITGRIETSSLPSNDNATALEPAGEDGDGESATGGDGAGDTTAMEGRSEPRTNWPSEWGPPSQQNVLRVLSALVANLDSRGQAQDIPDDTLGDDGLGADGSRATGSGDIESGEIGSVGRGAGDDGLVGNELGEDASGGAATARHAGEASAAPAEPDMPDDVPASARRLPAAPIAAPAPPPDASPASDVMPVVPRRPILGPGAPEPDEPDEVDDRPLPAPPRPQISARSQKKAGVAPADAAAAATATAGRTASPFAQHPAARFLGRPNAATPADKLAAPTPTPMKSAPSPMRIVLPGVAFPPRPPEPEARTEAHAGTMLDRRAAKAGFAEMGREDKAAAADTEVAFETDSEAGHFSATIPASSDLAVTPEAGSAGTATVLVHAADDAPGAERGELRMPMAPSDGADATAVTVIAPRMQSAMSRAFAVPSRRPSPMARRMSPWLLEQPEFQRAFGRQPQPQPRPEPELEAGPESRHQPRPALQSEAWTDSGSNPRQEAMLAPANPVPAAAPAIGRPETIDDLTEIAADIAAELPDEPRRRRVRLSPRARRRIVSVLAGLCVFIAVAALVFELQRSPVAPKAPLPAAPLASAGQTGEQALEGGPAPAPFDAGGNSQAAPSESLLPTPVRPPSADTQAGSRIVDQPDATLSPDQFVTFAPRPVGAGEPQIKIERTVITPFAGGAAGAEARGQLDAQAVAGANFVASYEVDKAAAALNDVLTRDPAHFGALVTRGRLNLLRDDFAAAAEDFSKARAAKPRAVSAALGEAEALLGLRRGADALAIVEGVIAANPDDAAAYDLRARAHGMTGAVDMIPVDCAELSWKLGHAFVGKWCEAMAYKDAGQVGEATAAFQASIADANEEFIAHRQRYLKFRGLYDGVVDGQAGPGTNRALAACAAEPNC